MAAAPDYNATLVEKHLITPRLAVFRSQARNAPSRRQRRAKAINKA